MFKKYIKGGISHCCHSFINETTFLFINIGFPVNTYLDRLLLKLPGPYNTYAYNVHLVYSMIRIKPVIKTLNGKIKGFTERSGTSNFTSRF